MDDKPTTTTDRQNTASGLIRIFGNRNFVLLWVALIISAIGDRFNQMAIQSTAPPESAGSYIALITFYSMLPYLLFTPVSGYLIDKFNRRRLLLLSDISRALLVFGLLILPLYHNLNYVLPVLFALGCFSSIFSPAKSAIVPNIVSRAELLSANALISSAGLISYLVGGIIAGVFIKSFGFNNAIFVDSLSFIASFILVFFIIVPSREHKSEVTKDFFGEVKNGLAYIYRHPLVQAMIGFEIIFWFAAAMFYVVSTQFIYTYISSDIALYGIMMAALGGGMLAGGLAFGKFGDRLSIRLWYPRLTLALGLSIIVFSSIFGFVPFAKYLSGFFLFLSGFFAGAFLIPISYVLQRIVPDHFLGRVFSATWMLSMVIYLSITLFSKYLLDTIAEPNAPVIILFGLGGILILLSFYMYLLARTREFSFTGGLSAIWYGTLRSIGWTLCKIFFLMKIQGAGNVPKTGAVIIVSNHASYFDPIFLGVSCPRRLHFMMTSKFFNTWAKWFFKSVRCISINEEGGNISALKEGLRVLRNDKALALFPEGKLTLDGQFQPLQPGAAAIACRANVWIQPVFIFGNYKTFPKGARFPKLARVSVVFGKPFKPVTGGAHPRDNINLTTAQIDESIRAIRDRKQ